MLYFFIIVKAAGGGGTSMVNLARVKKRNSLVVFTFTEYMWRENFFNLRKLMVEASVIVSCGSHLHVCILGVRKKDKKLDSLIFSIFI